MIVKAVRYPVLLLDADGTLYDFEKSQAKALEAAYHRAGFNGHTPYTPQILALYDSINQSWWRRLERGECNKQQLQLGRFREFLEALGLQGSPEQFNDFYMDELGNGSYLLPHALEVCNELAAACDLYIVTNGVSRTQHRRIGASPLAKLFRDIFVSEDAGAPKPEPRYFQYVFEKLKGIPKNQMLLVGDSLSSDMAGACGAGLDCCWLNSRRQPRPHDLPITYEIQDLRELPQIVFSSPTL